jgi:predicted Rossmann-fold nucleotide-binding protein
MKLLITGSRTASVGMLSYARKVVARAKELGWTVLVGDAPGIDAAVIEECDLLEVPVLVYGANGKMRHQTKTGTNVACLGSYTDRDRIMVEACDICMAIWNGSSRGTVTNYEAAKALGKEVHLYK